MKLRTLKKTVIILFAILLLSKILDVKGSVDRPPELPDYEKIDLETLIDVEILYTQGAEENVMNLIFLQTGLGKDGLDSVRKECRNVDEFKEELQRYQKQLFEGTNDIRFVPLRDGDVLVSMSQRLCYFVHGHAAIVTDAKADEILEARSYRAGSLMGTKERWSDISSVVVLRVKDEISDGFEKENGCEPEKEAATYAAENLSGLKYSLFKDLRPMADAIPEYTQCAHLVWYAYYASGLDIDENRGLIVKPKDFLESDVFEVVQVYGISPQTVLKMRSE